MESAEAILENENNSNVESESYLRQQQQQLSLQNTETTPTEQDGPSLMTGVRSGLSENNSDPEVLKSSIDKDDERGTDQGLANERQDETKEHEKQSKTELNESVNSVDNEIPMDEIVSEVENEPKNYDMSDIATNDAGHSSELGNFAGSEDGPVDDVGEIVNELKLDNENNTETTDLGHSLEKESISGNEREVNTVNESEERHEAEENEHVDLKNDADVGSSDQIIDSENQDDIDEELPALEENIKNDGEGESGGTQPHDFIEEDSNSEPPSLQKESVAGSDSILQFSPLGDNDLAPVSEDGLDSESFSGKEESKKTSNEDSQLDNEKELTEEVNSSGEERKMPPNAVSDFDDNLLSEAVEDEKESMARNVDGDFDEKKEMESNADGLDSESFSGKEESKKTSNEDSQLDNEKELTEEVNSPGEERKMPPNAVSDLDDNLLSEAVEDEKESMARNVDGDFDEKKEMESNADEQTGSGQDNVAVSLEEENYLLKDDETKENGHQVSEEISSDSKMEEESTENMEGNENDALDLGRENEAESEMEIESRDVHEKESSESTTEKIQSQITDTGNDDEGESEMEIESKDVHEKESSESNTDKIDSQITDICSNKGESEKGVESEDLSGVKELGDSETIRNEDELSKSSPVTELVNKEDLSGRIEEDMEDSSKDNVINDETINNVVDVNHAVNEFQAEKSAECVQNQTAGDDHVEKSPDVSVNREKAQETCDDKENSEVVGSSTDRVNNDPKKAANDVEEISNTQSEPDSLKKSNNSVCDGRETVEKTVSTDLETINKNGLDDHSSKRLEKEATPSDVIPPADIKKEVTETSTESNETPIPISDKELKKEISNDEDDVVILDDDEPMTVKKEAVEDKGKDSGQGSKLQSDSPGINKDSDDKSDKSGKSKTQKCIVCQKVTKCKFNIVRGGDTKQLCDDVCFKKFRKAPSRFLSKPEAAADPSQTKVQVAPPPTTSVLVINKGDTITALAPGSPALASILSSPQQLQPKPQQPQQKLEQGYKTCYVCQVINLHTPQSFCNWKGFDFCGEICLGKFQSTLRATCSNCFTFIPLEMRASYCTKIGNIMHPFCKQMCVSDFIKKLRTCACCKQDLSKVTVVIARVGADNRPKEFCSQSCVKKFEDQVQDVEIVHVEPSQVSSTSACSVCKSCNGIAHTVRFHSKTFKLCSDLCLSAFQYTNKINLHRCSTCNNMCTAAQSQPYFIQFEGETKRFCSDKCIGTFRLDNRKLASCTWCAARKVNFDMIERQDEKSKYQLFCSLNCLSLFRVNLQAKSNQAVECDRCRKIVPAQYHLTMSDASVRNFCSYACVMQFQSQFTARIAPPLPPLGGTSATTISGSVQQQKKVSQAAVTSAPAMHAPQIVPPPPTPPAKAAHPAAAAPTPPHPHGTRNRGRRVPKGTTKTPQPSSTSNASTTMQSSIPVISSVMSLAPEDEPHDTVTGEQLQEKTISTLLKTLEKKGTLVTGDGRQRLVVETPIPKMMKNKALQCKPICQTKATACRPHSQHKECQTDENMGKPVLVPIPVPIYIPMPTVMYQAPAPVPVPVAIPIPVPIFIPTTRKSANGIIKTIKEIQERMPADPLEAEILMMAEAVATDKKTDGDSDSDSEVEGDTGFEAPADDGDAKMEIPEKEGVGRAEDMIQMALRMAEEMTGPMEDLEASVQPIAVTSNQMLKQNQQPMIQTTNFDQHHEEDPDYMPIKAGRGRGNKRASRGRPPMAGRPKRQRTGRSFAEQEVEPEEQPPPPPRVEITEPPPDTNYRLKFTYGVNAWKHWVVTKNTELESAGKNNPKVRPLPVDVLKCTMDELHYSLCLFIKEVRKPNGEPYSPDSIYYLCLGIQQYLYENGRIDNIFTDLYFQRFTDSLHDVLKTLQPKVNSQGQMLCRIEEEHLWESKQLGAHSPYVLLNTLIYFHTKHFILKTASDHMSLSFAQILKHWKKGVPMKGNVAAKNASLRFYCLANNKKQDAAGRKGKDGGVPVYEVTENFDNPLRCPVKLYEFFLSKCPESIKNRNDIFYPVPERSCVPDSPVWYSTQSIEHHTMDKMLTRILLVREIQEAHLHAQPTYIKM